MTEPETDSGHRRFIERVLIVLAIGALALLLWRLRGLLLLVFGAVLVAVVLGLIAAPIRKRLGLSHQFALLAAVLLAAALIGTAIALFGNEILTQASTLRRAIPAAFEGLETRLEPLGLADPLRQWLNGIGSGSGILSRVGGFIMSVGSGLADTILVLFGGIYLAAQPELYRVGLLKLVPARNRPLFAEALDDSAGALRLWLLGRLVSMTVVGIATWFGL